MINYNNKTNKCLWRYANFLHYWRPKPPTCFGHQLWPSSRGCFSKDTLQRTQQRHTTSMMIRRTQHLNTLIHAMAQIILPIFYILSYILNLTL